MSHEHGDAACIGNDGGYREGCVWYATYDVIGNGWWECGDECVGD